jgi:hypothetical protein
MSRPLHLRRKARGTHCIEALVVSTDEQEAVDRQTNPYPSRIRTPILQSLTPYINHCTEPGELSRYTDNSMDWMAEEKEFDSQQG